MASTTTKRANALKTQKLPPPNDHLEGVPNFGVFIDTHRDKPHIGSFDADLHRGWCRPIIVHWAPGNGTTDGYLIRADANSMIDVDPAHRFVPSDWWKGFIMDYMSQHGHTPWMKEGENAGKMPTALLRDARNQIYHLKSFRQMVVWNEETQRITRIRAAKRP